jgi:hypothetical protein
VLAVFAERLHGVHPCLLSWLMTTCGMCVACWACACHPMRDVILSVSLHLQPVGEATEDVLEDPLALLALAEDPHPDTTTTTTGLDSLPATAHGRRRRHRSRSRKPRAEDPLVPAEEAPAAAELPSESNNQAAAAVDVEAGLGPRPPSVARAGSTTGGSPRTQRAATPDAARAASPFAGVAGQSGRGPSFGASADAAAAAAAAVPVLVPAKKASWVVRGVPMAHKYTDPIEVDITITNGGKGFTESGQGI